MPAAPSGPKPGARNERSRFRALHRLWKHPLGEVHGGTDATTGARVLVTALHAGAMVSDRVLEAAQQVAHEAAILPTHFIAKPVDVQRLSDGRIGIATEALEGTPLTNVSRNQPMPASRVYAMLRQLCRALAVAHGAGVVHRAISMGSVLLRARADKPDSIVLTDFALGPLLDADLVVQKEDAALQPVTPERISGQDHDHREDQYLLGCLGYTLLTGGAPFRTGTPDAVRRRHAIEDPMPVTDRLRGARSVPVALAGWVHRCLAKEPDDRFDDVAELEAALCFAQIEDRVQTPWDDLPAPEVDASRRARIVEGMQSKGGPRPVTIDDQITVARGPDFGTDEDDGDKTIVRAVQLPELGTASRHPAAPIATQFAEQSRSIVLEHDAALVPPEAAPTPPAATRDADTVNAPAPSSARNEETVDAPPPTEDTVAGHRRHDDTHIGTAMAADEPQDDAVVGGDVATFIGRDDTSPIDRRDTLIATSDELDGEEADTFTSEPENDATWGGPLHAAQAEPAIAPAPPLPSEQDTVRGPAPETPQEPLTLQAVRPPMPTSPPIAPAAAVPAAVTDEDDSLGELATRINYLPVRDGNTVIAPSPSPPTVEPPTSPIAVASGPTVVAAPAFTPAFTPTFTPDPPEPELALAPAPAPEPPAFAQAPTYTTAPPAMPAAAAPVPSSAWGPPPSADAQSFIGTSPASWGNAPVDTDMTMVGMGDFGRSRRIVMFILGAVAVAGLVAIFASSNRSEPPPPPPAEPAPAVTVKPTTPLRPRDPAFDTANTAAEFAVAGERALAQKRLEDAEELFQAAIIRDPKHVGALLGLGRMRADASDWQKADAYYQRAVNAAPKDGTARIAHGDALVRLSKVKDARREYKKAKQLGHPDAAARLAGL